MSLNTHAFMLGAVCLMALVGGCGDDDDDSSNNNGGSGGKGGTAAGTAGKGDTGGTDVGGGGTDGGGTDTGGTQTAGTAGAGGAAAGAGAGGEACVGDPPVVPRDECDSRERDQQGDDGFTLNSPDFDDCGEIPAKNSCEGNDFGTGDSPKFTWTGAPEGTKSFAAVFKDISLSNDAATERLGYHWVMWDIPADTTELPAGMSGGYESEEIPGAHQWSSLGSYGFFTPCPNPFPRDNVAPPFSCTLSQDSYSLTLYALSEETLDDLPPVELDENDMPVKNWVVAMGHYLEGLDALAVTEYRGTSKAWASAFVPPNAEKFPCTKDMGAAGEAATCLH